MPKLQNPQDDNAAFLAGVDSALQKVHNKAKQTRRFYNECHGDEYWRRQREKMHRGETHAELTPWIIG